MKEDIDEERVEEAGDSDWDGCLDMDMRLWLRYNCLGSMSSPSTPCQGMSDLEEPLRDIGGPGMKPPVADFINLSSFTGTGSWELELKKLHWFLIHSLINYNTAHLWRDFWTSLMLSSISPLYLDSGQNHTVWHSLSFCFFPCQTCWDIFVDLFLSKTLLNNFKTNTLNIFFTAAK